MLAVHIPHTHDAYLTNTGTTVGATATCRTWGAGRQGERDSKSADSAHALLFIASSTYGLKKILFNDTKDASILRNGIPSIIGRTIN